MIAGSVQTPGNGRKIARCGLIADISRTITAGTPGDVRYIQYNIHYIEYLTRGPGDQRSSGKPSSSGSGKREAEAGSPAAEPHPQGIAAGAGTAAPGS